MATNSAGSSATTQIAYAPENWGIAGAYTYASGDNGVGLYAGNATAGAVALSTSDVTNSFGLSAWWVPEESGWIPSVSTGFGLTDVSDSNLANVDSATLTSWYVGLEWDDVFIDGNSLGIAGGQPTFISAIDDEDASKYDAEGGYAWELFYKFQVTDNITVTPAIHYLSNPFANTKNKDDVSAFGGLIKTTFRF